MNDLSVYERITVNNQNYILVHSLPDNLQNGNDLNYQIEEIIFGRPDFTASWNQEDIYIIGHTPTFQKFQGAESKEKYIERKLICIDY